VGFVLVDVWSVQVTVLLNLVGVWWAVRQPNIPSAVFFVAFQRTSGYALAYCVLGDAQRLSGAGAVDGFWSLVLLAVHMSGRCHAGYFRSRARFLVAALNASFGHLVVGEGA
jgi:hypothetical protein